MFKQYYNRRFQEILGSSLQLSDGFGDDIVQVKLVERELSLPNALFDYYAIAGQHPINLRHNQLLSIEHISWLGHKLIVMQENQGIACWAIDQSDLDNPNPIVWQGTKGSNRDAANWYEEQYKLSQFLMAMWKWTLTGEQEEPEFFS